MRHHLNGQLVIDTHCGCLYRWEQNELTQLEEEQNKRRIAAFHEWEERMGEAEVMESGRGERIKELQKVSFDLLFSYTFIVHYVLIYSLQNTSHLSVGMWLGGRGN